MAKKKASKAAASGKGINLKRVLIGGLAAAVLMNVLGMLLHGVWLAEDWKLMSSTHGIDFASTQQSAGMGWMTLDLMISLVMVWLYAAIRPRFGAGPKTALIAGFAVFLLTHGMFSSYMFMGYMSSGHFCKATVAALVTSLSSALLGAWLYKE